MQADRGITRAKTCIFPCPRATLTRGRRGEKLPCGFDRPTFQRGHAPCRSRVLAARRSEASRPRDRGRPDGVPNGEPSWRLQAAYFFASGSQNFCSFSMKRVNSAP
jgi:hypothetical protein